MHLVYRLARYESIILFSVIWQDPRFNKKYSGPGAPETLEVSTMVGGKRVLIRSKNKHELSFASPSQMRIYLGGVQSHLHPAACSLQLSSVELAEQWFDVIKVALSKFSTLVDWDNPRTGFSQELVDNDASYKSWEEIELELRESSSLIHLPPCSA